jgi:hypothetical protein
MNVTSPPEVVCVRVTPPLITSGRFCPCDWGMVCVCGVVFVSMGNVTWLASLYMSTFVLPCLCSVPISVVVLLVETPAVYPSPVGPRLPISIIGRSSPISSS